MSFDSNGQYNRLYRWVNDRDANIAIMAERMDNEFDEIANALTAIVQGNQPFKGALRGPDGSATAPTFSFENANTTGVFRKAGGGVGITVAGTEKASIESDGLHVDTIHAQTIDVTGTVDGRDVSADGATLDAINSDYVHHVPSPTVGNLIEAASADGRNFADAGVSAGELARGASSSGANNLVLFADAGGKNLADSGHEFHGLVTPADTYSDLQALPSSMGIVFVKGRDAANDGGGGVFVWVAGDQSANVSADPQHGVWVPPASDTSGASGAWKRIISGNEVRPEWFGVANDRVAINAAIDWIEAQGGGTIRLSNRVYEVDQAVGKHDVTAPIRIVGGGKYTTVIFGNFPRSTDDAIVRMGFTSNANRVAGNALIGVCVCGQGLATDPVAIDDRRSFQSEIRDVLVPSARGEKVLGSTRKHAGMALLQTEVNNSEVVSCELQAGGHPAPFSISSTARISISAGSTTATSNEAVFTSDMVGHYLMTAAEGNMFFGKINSVVSATQVTLDRAPTQDVNSAPFGVGFYTATTTAGSNTITLNAPLSSDYVGAYIFIPEAYHIAYAAADTVHGTTITAISGNSVTLADAPSASATDVPILINPVAFVGSLAAEMTESRQTNDISWRDVQLEGYYGGLVVNRAIYARFNEVKLHGIASYNTNDFGRGGLNLMIGECKQIVLRQSQIAYGYAGDFGQVHVSGSVGSLIMHENEIVHVPQGAPIVYISDNNNADFTLHVLGDTLTDGVSVHGDDWKPYRVPSGRENTVVGTGLLVRYAHTQPHRSRTLIEAGGIISGRGALRVPAGQTVTIDDLPDAGTLLVTGRETEIFSLMWFRCKRSSASLSTTKLTVKDGAYTASRAEATYTSSNDVSNRLNVVVTDSGIVLSNTRSIDLHINVLLLGGVQHAY